MGEGPAFEELFRREFPRLVRAFAVCEGVEDAADAVLDAFVEANRRWSTVSHMTDPAGWVRPSHLAEDGPAERPLLLGTRDRYRDVARHDRLRSRLRAAFWA